MYRLLLIALFAVSSNVSASNIFKLTNNSFVCLDKSDVRTFISTVRERSEDVGMEYLDFLVDTNRCFILKPVLVKLVDVDGDIYGIRPLEVPDVLLWVHKIHLDN